MNMTTRSRDSIVDAQPIGSANFSELIEETQATPKNKIDDMLQNLESHKREWAQLNINERLLLLEEVREELWKIKDKWVDAELKAKEIPAGSFGVAEEWVILAQVFRAIRQIETALKEILNQGRPRIPGHIASGPGARSVFQVFPQTIWDRLIFQGVKGSIWMEPGISSHQVFEQQAKRYREQDYPGGVALVLGAGNGGMLPFCDSFHKLFVDLQVVVLKMNPVNAHLGLLIEKSFQGFIRRGFVAIVYGGADVGEYLCSHPLVEELHMTGSDKTFDAIVFGTGDEGQRRKLDRKPFNTKPFTGELGNITPLIVVPGPWKNSDIDDYAKHIATWLVVNAGFACLTPRMIIQHESWPERIRFMEAIRRALSQYPTRKAYYPGAFKIHNDFVSAHPEALLIGDVRDDHLPWTIIPDLDPGNKDDICFKREGFGSLCAEISLEANTVEDFLDEAVDFANNTLWGSLCAILIVHPKSLKIPGVAKAIERAVAKLRYGTVAVNMLAFYATYFMVCPWGAIPGHDIYDVQSGRGKNFNFLMLEHVEKSVVRAPFKRIDPLTIRSKRAHIFARKLTNFEAYPSWFKLADLMLTAIRS